MKNWIVFSLIFFCIPVIAQKADLPKKVIVTFDQKFPGIKDVKWKEEKGDYKIKFNYKGKNTTTEISEEGKWKKTTIHVLFDEMPGQVQAIVNSNKKGGEISDPRKVTEDGEYTVYKVDIIQGNTVTKLKIDETGKLLKLETETKGGDNK